ncbi:MAG UNVERIFIED_CONTAM: hypothetical protein LVR18_00965 [Planctomycetaceae bacterium]|jgi:hypothetical protein
MSTITDNTIESTPRRHVSERASVRVAEELDSLVQHLRRQLWLQGSCLAAGLAMVVLLSLTVIDAIVQPQSAVARFLLCLAGVVLCAETIRRNLWRPIREHCSRLSLAWTLEQRHPQIEERLTSTLQLAAQHDKKSSAFVEAIATQAQSGMASCSEESLAGQSVRKAIVIATICIGIFALGLLLAPERLIPSLANVLRPWHDRLLPRLTAQVIPGHAEIAEARILKSKLPGFIRRVPFWKFSPTWKDRAVTRFVLLIRWSSIPKSSKQDSFFRISTSRWPIVFAVKGCIRTSFR